MDEVLTERGEALLRHRARLRDEDLDSGWVHALPVLDEADIFKVPVVMRAGASAPRPLILPLVMG